MNNRYLYDLCNGRKWVEVREFLDSDSTNKDKKRELVRIEEGVPGHVYIGHAGEVHLLTS